jgi:hypothetical protein
MQPCKGIDQYVKERFNAIKHDETPEGLRTLVAFSEAEKEIKAQLDASDPLYGEYLYLCGLACCDYNCITLGQYLALKDFRAIWECEPIE